MTAETALCIIASSLLSVLSTDCRSEIEELKTQVVHVTAHYRKEVEELNKRYVDS